MKRILLVCLFTAALLPTQSKASHVAQPLTIQIGQKKVHVTGTVTLNGGCVVKYDLVLDISLLPAQLNGMTGSLSFSGNCSTQQIVIGSARASVTESKEIVDLQLFKAGFASKDSQLEFESALQKQLNQMKLFE